MPHTTNEPEQFDLCIIGAGSGLSLVDDDVSDWKIALIDNGIGPTHIFGGTCLNAGCIPTKMLAVPASYTLTPQQAGRVDVDLTLGGIDFKAIQARTFGRTDAIAAEGLAGLEPRENVEVIFGAATFTDAHTVRVGHRLIRADHIVIAAGSRPRLLDAPGFDDPYLQAFVHTSETIMRVDELPKRLVILGGGVEAVEFAHIFAAMGSQVAVIARGGALLRHQEPEVSELVTAQLAERTVLRLNQQVSALDSGDDGGVVVTATDATGIEYTYGADAVLVCIGRVPNGDQLRCDQAGITLDAKGFVPVDEHLRTEVPHIWALGDVCAPQMLKHLANRQAQVVKHNLLASRDGGELRVHDGRFVPQGVFGEPEIACMGATSAELDEAGTPYLSYLHRYAWVAYGWALNEEEHFVKLLGDAKAEKLLGAHIVGPQATALIQPLQLAISLDLTIDQLIDGQYWIHPALTEVVENALIGLREQASQ